MEIIEQIGSYAGLAAILGLAVLSALYFSQARDVRRLREGEEARGAGAVPEQPPLARGPRRPTAAAVPGQGAAAPAAAQEERPEGAPQAQPSPAASGGAQDSDEERAAPAAAAAPVGSGAAAVASGGADPAETQTWAPQGGSAGGRPPQRPATFRPPLRPGATAAALRSASPPTVKGFGLPWYRRLPPRYLALIVAGIVVVGAGAVYAATALMGEGEGASGADVASELPGSEEAVAPLDPSTITVAVLNGTEVAGLAGQIADSVEAAGFQRGNVSNAPEQGGTAESAVLFADGARRAARQVGQELGIAQIEPLDEESRVLAGAADVVVIVGADEAE